MKRLALIAAIATLACSTAGEPPKAKVYRLELTEDRLSVLQQALDLAVKSGGLNAAKGISDLWQDVVAQVKPQMEPQ